MAACSAQPNAIIGHSYRTWLLGSLFADLDRTQLDQDLFFCAALLHDWGLVNPSASHDFTLDSAAAAVQCAKSAGISRQQIDLLQNGICEHATIGVSAARNPLAYYVQWGAMADLAGLRRWQVGYANLYNILGRHPYPSQFKSSMIALTQKEAIAFPAGRFAFYLKWHLAALIDWAGLYP